MSIVKCYEPDCDNEVELSCNCTSPETYSCEKHLIGHCKSVNKPHNFIPIFSEPIEGTKEAILNFFREEKSRNDEIKVDIIASFSQTLCRYQNLLQQILKDIDSDSTKINRYDEKICQVKKLSKLEKDPLLNLLALQPTDAIEKAKEMLTAKTNNVELFSIMGSQIDAIIKSFNEGTSKVISIEMNPGFKNTPTEYMNFENENENIKSELNKYKEAIKIDPNDEYAYLMIGAILNEEKRYEEAIKYYNDAIRIKPNEECLWTFKGNALKKLGRREEAMKCYEKVISNHPDSELELYGIGNIFYDEKRYEEAVMLFSKAIGVGSNIACFHENKANALKKLGRREEAIECYKDAIKINPNNASAYYGIGNIFYDENRYGEAIEYYQNAFKIKPCKAIYYAKCLLCWEKENPCKIF